MLLRRMILKKMLIKKKIEKKINKKKKNNNNNNNTNKERKKVGKGRLDVWHKKNREAVFLVHSSAELRSDERWSLYEPLGVAGACDVGITL